MKFYDYYYIDEGFKQIIKSGLLGASILSSTLGNDIDPYELYHQIAEHEGVVSQIYNDSVGKETIGVGFNLNEPHNIRFLESIGITLNDLRKGKKLNESEIIKLYNFSIRQAWKDARKFLPNLDKQPEQVQRIVIDMAFNLGYTKLSKFVNMRDALIRYDYKTAADEMMDSLWARQVKSRAIKLSNMMRHVKL